MKAFRQACITIFLGLLCSTSALSQRKSVDSLQRLINTATSDTQRINLKIKQFNSFGVINLDSAIILGEEVIKEAASTGYQMGEIKARTSIIYLYSMSGDFEKAKESMGTCQKMLSTYKNDTLLGSFYTMCGTYYGIRARYDTAHTFYTKASEIATRVQDIHSLSTIYKNNAICYQQESNFPLALENFQKALDIARKQDDEKSESNIYLNSGLAYYSLGDYEKAVENLTKAEEIAKKLGIKNVLTYAYSNLASVYSDMKDYQKEYNYGMLAFHLAGEIKNKGIESSSLTKAGNALLALNKLDSAELLIRRSLSIADSSKQPTTIFQTYGSMGNLLRTRKKYKEAIPYFEKALNELGKSEIYINQAGYFYSKLSECYEETGDYKRALEKFKTSASILDSIRGKENVRKATELTMKYEFAQTQQKARDEQEKKDEVTKERQKGLIAALLITFILGVVALRGWILKRRANAQINKQKAKVENTLSELKLTQAQLVQSEKMASLGELTAGIAHEIQNPLNFVNNFSEVSNELINEMKEELSAGNTSSAIEIADEVSQNLDRINHHGKRADAIVKGMLQHSRVSTGQKEPTDLNAFCEEYLRLSYHGMRGKDKSFQANFKTVFDSQAGKVNIVRQDVGRVLLNIINNAFYAVNQKQKTLEAKANQVAGEEYAPTVTLATKKINNKVEITISDNGTGISQKIIGKIFQPFFTTKPTGQGTGLGLSLTYDMVKAHGGELTVESTEGDGATFKITLPA